LPNSDYSNFEIYCPKTAERCNKTHQSEMI
jgi:hypothetical protein